MLPLEFDLTANQEATFSRVGRTVFVKSATGEVEVTGYSSGGILVGKARMVAGNRYRMAADFTRLQIKDTSGAANSLQMLAGLGDFSEAGLGTIDSITSAVSVAPIMADDNDGSTYIWERHTSGGNPFTGLVGAAGIEIVAANIYIQGGAANNYILFYALNSPGPSGGYFDIARAIFDGTNNAIDRLTYPIRFGAGTAFSVTFNGTAVGRLDVVGRPLS